MPFKVGEAYIELTAKGNKLDAELRAAKSRVHTAVTGMKQGFSQLTTSVNRVAKSIFNVRNAIIALGTAWITTRVFRSAIREANEFETSVARLNSIIKSTGGAAGYTSDELVRMAGSLEKMSTYSDTAIMSAQAIILTFKNLSGEVFERTLKSAMDMAQVMRTDVASAAVMLAKALNEPVMNLGALSRSGVQFNKQQRDMIKTLWESGKQLEAQRMILAELESEFGGVSETIANTFGGSVERLRNFLSDLKREFGFVITSSSKWTEAIKDLTHFIGRLTEKLHEANFSQFSDDLLELARAITTSVITAFKNLTGVVLLLLSEMNAFKGLWAEFQKGEMRGAIEALMEDIRRGHPKWKVWGGRDLNYIKEKMTKLEEVKKKYAEYTEAAKKAREMEERIERVSKTVREGFEQTRNVVELAGKALEGYYDDWAGVNEVLTKTIEKHGKLEGKLSKEGKKFDDWVKAQKDILDPMRVHLRYVDQLIKAYKEHKLTLEEVHKLELKNFEEIFGKFKAENEKVKESVSSLAKTVQNVWSDTINNMKNSLADWIETAKFSFDSIVDLFHHAMSQLLASWITTQLQMAAKSQFGGEGLIGAIISGIGGLFGAGGGGGSYKPTAGKGEWTYSFGSTKAMASGGIINEPVYGVGQRSGRGYLLGEGGPEAVTPLNAAGTNVTVNIENKGTGKEGKAQVMFDPKGMIVNVILEDLHSYGPIYQNLKGGT